MTILLDNINSALAKAIECLARDPKRAERLLGDVKRWVGELGAAGTTLRAAGEPVAWEIRFGYRQPASVELTPFASRAEEARRLGLEVHDLVRRGAAPQASAEAVPLLAGDHTGMRVDYSGLLMQAANALVAGQAERGLAEMLRQLQGHLTEIGLRWYAGDTGVVDEFCQLYAIAGESRTTLKSAPAAAPVNDGKTRVVGEHLTGGCLNWDDGEDSAKGAGDVALEQVLCDLHFAEKTLRAIAQRQEQIGDVIHSVPTIKAAAFIAQGARPRLTRAIEVIEQLADRQQPKTYRDSADFHSNAFTVELAAWQRGWDDSREPDRQQRDGDVALPPPYAHIGKFLDDATAVYTADQVQAIVLADRQHGEDLALDDRDQLRAEIVALKGTIADLKADSQQRGGDVEPVAPDDDTITESWISASDADGLAYDGPSFESGYRAGEIAERDRAALAAQPAANAPVVPLEIVAILNAATGSNEWQGDHPRTELAEPACRAVADLAVNKAGAFKICAQIAEQFPFSPNVGRAIAAKIREAESWPVLRSGASMSVGLEPSLDDAMTAAKADENIREGYPYDHPEFEALCRERGIWGTAESALCAVFWRAARKAGCAAAMDSQRLSWLCNEVDASAEDGNAGALVEIHGCALDGHEIRATIDAAISAQQGKEGK